MGNGPAERRFGVRPFGVDVDPLVVAGGIGEEVDPGLVDLDPVAGAEVLADRYLEGMRRLQEEAFGADIGGLSIEEMVDRQIDPYIAFSDQHLVFKHAFLGAEVSTDLAAAMAKIRGSAQKIGQRLEAMDKCVAAFRSFDVGTWPVSGRLPSISSRFRL